MTQAGLMPPWMPGTDSAPLVGRRPPPAHAGRAATLADWAAAGAPAGNPADRHTRAVDRRAASPARARTITLRRRSAYVPHAAGGGIDDYHCFLLDPKLQQDEFVTGALIKPQRTGIVHHVILYEAAGAQAAAASRLNAANGGKGWTCFGGPDLPLDVGGARRDRPPRPAALDRRLGARAHDERAAGRDGRAAAQRARWS